LKSLNSLMEVRLFKATCVALLLILDDCLLCVRLRVRDRDHTRVVHLVRRHEYNYYYDVLPQISVPEELQNGVCGLCGSYNSRSSDDFVSRHR
jgi:hypothetical protein